MLLVLMGGQADVVPDNIVVGGQSSGVNLVTYGGDAYTAVSGDVLLNAATSGVALLTSNGGAWVDIGIPAYGAAYDNFIAVSTGKNPSAIVFDQGESDYITNYGFDEQYRMGLGLVFDKMRTDLGPLPIYTIIPWSTSNGGGAWDGSTIDQSVQMVREQYWYHQSTSPSFVKKGPERFDIPAGDSQHHTSAGYITIAQRLAAIIGGASAGPEVSSVSRIGDTITVNLAHGDGTDITPTTGLEGFVYFYSGSEIAVSSATRASATSITLVLASTPAGDGTLHHIYGKNKNVTDITKITHDNSILAMPLRAGKWTV